MPTDPPFIAIGIVVAILFLAFFVTRLIRTVDAGTIRLVSWWGGKVNVYRGPTKSLEIPLLTTVTIIPSKAINIDLDIADQTADVDSKGQPRPIKVRVLASAIVSVGDTNESIRTAANRFFAMPMPVQNSTLTDLLTSTGRRAINLLHHDELFNAKVSFPIDYSSGADQAAQIVKAVPQVLANAEDEDRLALIIKSACSRELEDLGLVFNSLNIKEVQSEVAEARRRQSAVEAKANADIVQADQERRAREAQLGAEQAVNDKQRDLEQRRAQNAAVIAAAEAEKQNALQGLREAELRATQIAQATADAEKMKVQAEAQAEAEYIKIRRVAEAQADAIRLVNAAIAEGGQAYLTLRQLEMLPQIAPVIGQALASAKLVNITTDGKGAAGSAADQITGVIQTVLAAQLVQTALKTDGSVPALAPVASAAPVVEASPAPAARPVQSAPTAVAPKPPMPRKSDA